MWLIDPKDDKPSVTLTMFALGFAVALVKLLLSGVTVLEVSIEQFTGMDFAACIAALGGVYSLRRMKTSKDGDSNDK